MEERASGRSETIGESGDGFLYILEIYLNLLKYNRYCYFNRHASVEIFYNFDPRHG